MESSRRKTFGERDKYTNTADSIKEKTLFRERHEEVEE